MKCCSAASEKILWIEWQRLVHNGETCRRCRETELELEKALKKLRELLRPNGVRVILDKTEIDSEEFKKNPLDSNRIFINGRPMEFYLNARVGESPCCDICVPHSCRTIEVDGKTYEVPSSELIVKAALNAIKETSGCC